MGNASKKEIDPQYLKPQGGAWSLTWEQKEVKRYILEAKLAPFWTPFPDPANDEAEECPICFFYYSGGLNRAKCCSKSICTECFLKIKQPGKDTSTCPFCNRGSWQVAFTGPRSKEEKEKEAQEEKQVTELMEKMRLAEIEQDRQRDEQKRRQSAPSSASNSVASSPAPSSPIPHSVSPSQSPFSSPPSGSTSNSRHNSGVAPQQPAFSVKNVDTSSMTEEELEQAMLEEAIRISLLEDQGRQATNQPSNAPSTAPHSDGIFVPFNPFSSDPSQSAVVGPTVTIANPFADDIVNHSDELALLEALRLSKQLSSQPLDLSSSSDSDEPKLVRKPRNDASFNH